MQQLTMLALVMVIMRFVKEESMRRRTSTFSEEIREIQKQEVKRERPGWTPERKAAHRAALLAAREGRKKAQQNGVTAELKNVTE
jgi:hypothetical protein